MSRLLYRLSYPAVPFGVPNRAMMGGYSIDPKRRAPMRNRTADLLLTMETLYRLSYRGQPSHNDTGPRAGAQNHSGRRPEATSPAATIVAKTV